MTQQTPASPEEGGMTMSLLRNPAQDELLCADEREFVREVIHAYAKIVREGERVFSQFCESRGVPEDVCMRAMIQTSMHQAGTNAAHLLAMSEADDFIVATEGQQLAERMKGVINKQMPLSRETDARTRSADHG